MKTKLVRPVLIPIKSEYTLTSDRINLILSKEKVYNPFKNQYYDLSLISLDSNEKIEDGDTTFINIGINGTVGVISYDEKYKTWDLTTKDDIHYPYTTKEYFKKIIAQQSQLSPELINKLIEEYNTTGRFEDFEIEMITMNKGYNSIDYVPYQEIEIPKLTNGFIIPVEKPSPYTLTEPLDIKALESMNRIINSIIENFNSKSKNKAFICKEDKLQNTITYSEQEVANLFNKYARKLSYEVFTNGIQTPNQSLDFTMKWFELNKKK